MAVSSELRPWLHPGLPRLRGGLCGSHCVYTQPKGVGEQSETQRSPWGALCKGPRQRTQEMMSLPGNRTQQNPEPRYPGLHSGEEPQSESLLPRYSAVCPCPEAGALGELTGRVCGDMVNAASGPPPPRGLWPFAGSNRKVTREPQAGPGPLSHPNHITLSPFPVSVDGGFSRCVGLKQAQADVGQKPVGRVCPHPRGEQAGQDGESPGSAGYPG